MLIPPLNTLCLPCMFMGGLRRVGDGDLDSHLHTVFAEAVPAVVMLPECLPISGGNGWTKYVHAHGGMLLALQSGGDSDVLENTLLKAFLSLCGST